MYALEHDLEHSEIQLTHVRHTMSLYRVNSASIRQSTDYHTQPCVLPHYRDPRSKNYGPGLFGSANPCV
ncbi:hypothetical protein CC79DRAFT_1333574 [Sarocladium strictum]